MTDNDNSNHHDLQNGNDDKQRAQRSSSYTVINQAEAIDFVDVIYKKLGTNKFHDKYEIAKAHNLSHFSIKQILSTCQQYGLLVNKHGEGYKPTELFVSIIHPKSDSEKRLNLIESFNSSELFKKLNTSYNGSRLPALQGITSTIIRDSGLKPDIAIKVANIYIDNLRAANVVDANEFVLFSDKPVTPTKGDEGKTDIKTPPAFTPPPDENIIDILIPLRDKKQAHLFIPEEYKDSDLNRIIKFVEALKNDDPT
jgi:hypothetical protein